MISYTVTPDQLPKYARKLVEQSERLATQSMPRLMKTISGIMRADAMERFQTQTSPKGKPWKMLKHPRPNGGSNILQSSGLLRREATAPASFQIQGTSVVHTVKHPGAATHNFGAVITPKSAKFLAIPITKEAARAKSARHFPRPLGCVIFPSGKGILYEKSKSRKKRRGKKNKGVPGKRGTVHYVLVKSVRIPQRKFMGISPKAKQQIEDAIIEHYWDAVQQSSGRL